MRVVFAFTTPHPLAVTALHRYAPLAEHHDVSGSDHAYWRLVSDLWAQGKPFAIIEHDVEIHTEVLGTFASCASPWCVFGYAISWGDSELLTRGLGCVRFGAEAMATVRDATTDPHVLGPGQVPATDWRRLDTRIAGRLASAGFEPCVHTPPVAHHHRYRIGDTERCACGTDHG